MHVRSGHGQEYVRRLRRMRIGVRRAAKGSMEEILGDHRDPGLEIDVAVRSHGIPWEWPEAALKEAAALEAEPGEADKRHRVDLRELPFVTICLL